MNAMCDKCQHIFEPININRKKQDKTITYFECPKCREKYITTVTTPEIQAMQADLRDMQAKYRKQGIQDWTPIYDLQKEIKKLIRKEKRALDK